MASAFLDQDCYQLKGQCFSTYGFEYKPGYADGVRLPPSICVINKLIGAKYISWITDDKLVWAMNGNMVGADTATEIGARQVPVEPMVCSATKPRPSSPFSSASLPFTTFHRCLFSSLANAHPCST